MKASPRPHTTRNLAAAGAVLTATALLPTGLTGWLSVFREPMEALIVPVSGPASVLGSMFRPEERLPHPDADTPQGELIDRVDELTRQYFALVDRLAECNDLVRELQEGAAFQSGVEVSRVEATRVGRNLGSGTIDVSRGSRDGVREGSVAVARRSQQIIGIVTTVGPMVSTVHLLTDRRLSPGLMVGVVMPRDARAGSVDLGSLPTVQLKPAGDGTLVAEEVGIAQASRIERGQRVRLMDETWPSAASMLVLGQVQAVEPIPDNPLFRRVVVRPEVVPDHTQAMIVHIPREGESGVRP